MVRSAAESVKDRAKANQETLNVQHIVEKQTKDLQDQLSDSKQKVDRLKGIVRKCKEDEVHYQTEISHLKEEVTKREYELKNKPEKDHHSGAGDANANLFHASQEPGVKLARAVNEEAKKWQSKVDAVKDKLRLKSTECERLERSNQLLKENLARADKERVSRTLAREAKDSGITSATQKQMLDSLEATRKQNLELHDEVAYLKRQALLGKDGAMEEMQLRNRLLQQKVDELQEELTLRTPRKEGSAGLQDAYARLAEREEALQESNLQLAQENIELKFQAEQAKVEIPKLMSKIGDLQQQIEALNSELYDKPVKERKVIGTTGKTVAELEKTIGLMKKVMEKTQAENEKLKRSPAVMQSTHVEQLQNENKTLKDELSECRKAVETDMASRYDSLQVGTAKVAAENERLLIEIQREREESETERGRVREVSLKNEELHREIEQMQEAMRKLRRRDFLDQSMGATGGKTSGSRR